MWLIEVFSEGDLLNDDYLRVNERVEQDDDGHFFDTYDARFWGEFMIDDRIDEIDSCIKRLNAEKEHLLKYRYSLVGKTSYEDIGKW